MFFLCYERPKHDNSNAAASKIVLSSRHAYIVGDAPIQVDDFARGLADVTPVNKICRKCYIYKVSRLKFEYIFCKKRSWNCLPLRCANGHVLRVYKVWYTTSHTRGTGKGNMLQGSHSEALMQMN